MQRTVTQCLVLCLLLASCFVLSARAAEINGNLVLSGSLNGATTTGTGAAYIATPSPPIKSYRTGTLYSFVSNVANTVGPVNINYSGLGNRVIKKVIAGVVTDLVANDILAGMPVVMVYDGTFFRMVSLTGFTTQTIASGATTIVPAAIASGTCVTPPVSPAAAAGVLATDAIIASFNADVTGTTGYTGATSGTLRIDIFPSAGNINFRICNNTATSITAGANVTINWRVVR